MSELLPPTTTTRRRVTRHARQRAAVASLGGSKRGAPPRVTPSRGGGDTRIKLFFVAGFRTLDKRRGKMGVVRRPQLRKVITLQRAMTKKVVGVFFPENRVTPSVAAPGDTNPSGATGRAVVHAGQLTHTTWLFCMNYKNFTTAALGDVRELYNAMKLLRFSERISYVVSQAHNFTTAQLWAESDFGLNVKVGLAVQVYRAGVGDPSPKFSNPWVGVLQSKDSAYLG